MISGISQISNHQRAETTIFSGAEVFVSFPKTKSMFPVANLHMEAIEYSCYDGKIAGSPESTFSDIKDVLDLIESVRLI